MSLTAKIKQKFYDHLIYPLLDSYSPISHAALGAAVGMFWGMTPTVGIQMWLVWMTWLCTKFLFKVRFDLVIGTAMVWISNPITMFPMYYGFLLTGYKFFGLIGVPLNEITYQLFTERLTAITTNPDSGTWDVMKEGGQFLILDLGYPMVIGSLFYAIPFAVLAFIYTEKLLLSTRTSKAEKLGMSYEEWRVKFEHDADEHNIKEVKQHLKEPHHPVDATFDKKKEE